MPVHAERFAVLAVDADANAQGQPAQAATAVRDALSRRGLVVLDVKQTAERIAAPRGAAGYDVSTLKTRLDKAESVNSALDLDGSMKILQSVVDDLARDPDFTRDKQHLLEEARLRLVTRLVSSAGPKETGEGESDNGKRARALLVDALRGNPRLVLDEARFPPKVRRLLARATETFKRIPTGPLTVTSRPSGASVYLEGREVGKTPLKLTNVVPQGNYRIWCEMAGVRSVTKQVAIGEKTPDVVVDLQFEGALWPKGPGLRPVAGTTLDEDVAKKVGRFLDVDALLLVGTATYDDGAWLYGIRFTVAEGESARRGAVRIDDGTSIAAAAETLAGFLGRGEAAGSINAAPVPKEVLPQAPVVAAATPAEAEEPLPWPMIGAIAGSGAVVLLLTAGGAAGYWLWPRDGHVATQVEVLE